MSQFLDQILSPVVVFFTKKFPRSRRSAKFNVECLQTLDFEFLGYKGNCVLGLEEKTFVLIMHYVGFVCIAFKHTIRIHIL